MFYNYVKELPLVADNPILNRGGRMEFSVGHLRKAKPDSKGFRAFILYDKMRDVSYRVTNNGMLVEYGEDYDYQRHFVDNPLTGVKHTNFAVDGDAAEINSFLYLLERMTEEYDQRRSIIGKIKNLMKEPLGRIVLLVAVVYAIITTIVLIHG